MFALKLRPLLVLGGFILKPLPLVLSLLDALMNPCRPELEADFERAPESI